MFILLIDTDEQPDSTNFSPTRQTEAFIISETEDESRAGNNFFFLIINYILNLYFVCNNVTFYKICPMHSNKL